jgi:Ala-tRNA(Pro) deacylase
MQHTSEVLNKIIKLLDQSKVDYDRIIHPPVHTSEEAARIRDTNPHQGAKAIVFALDSKPALVVVPGDRKVSLKDFKKAYGIKDMHMLSAEEIQTLVGLEIGAIPPFGNMMELDTYVDQSLFENLWIVFNVGSHTQSVKMKSADFVRLCKPIVGKFAV